ncbi:MAG: ABC transporter ATP-binding protein [Chitinophagales bacterium]|mgnify:CR=1 FL=1|nr:ABC transporter ATP-binding protein [Chitinophagales bacterium]
MAYILEAKNLTKQYGSLKALTNFNLKIEPGSIYGLLGPNGSGKTTCLSILLDVIKADNGRYEWFGTGPSHNTRRRRIGALIETPNFYPYLSGLQNLEVVATIKNRHEKNTLTALQATGLMNRRNSKFSTYSLGMKQRLAIASALINKPEVLVLDEPTNGLDPQGIAEIRELILEIAKEGKTILLASHLLDEVEKVCTHVAIMKSGELLASGKVADVLGQGNQVEIAAENLETLAAIAKELSGLTSLEKKQETLLLKFNEPMNTAALNKYFFEKGITLTQLNMRRKTLESQYLELTSAHA